MTSPVDPAWVPILRLDESAWLGLVGASLHVGSQSEPRRELDLSNPIGLLPCLGRTRRGVVSELATREAELSCVPGWLIDRVPLRLVPSAAVSTRMEYWVLRALDWLEDGAPDVADVALLDEIDQSDWASQRVRHRARQILRKPAARS